MNDSKSYCYQLQALRSWIRDLDIKLRSDEKPDPDEKEFLFQLDLCFDDLLEKYKAVYINNSNMIKPSVFEKEFHFPNSNLSKEISGQLPKTKFDTDQLTKVLNTDKWREDAVLQEFMTYFQDTNWPIAQEVIRFFLNMKDQECLVEPLGWALRESLLSNDDFWGLNLLTNLVTELPREIVIQVEEEINDWSRSDLFSSIEAICIMAKFRIGKRETIQNRIGNLLSATQTWTEELKLAQKTLD